MKKLIFKLAFYLPSKCPNCGKYGYDPEQGNCSKCGYLEFED